MKWLLDHGHASDDGEAIAVGNALLKRGTMSLVLGGEATFNNDDTLYRFRIHDEQYQSAYVHLCSTFCHTVHLDPWTAVSLYQQSMCLVRVWLCRGGLGVLVCSDVDWLAAWHG